MSLKTKITQIICMMSFGVFDPSLSKDLLLKWEDIEVKRSDFVSFPFEKEIKSQLAKKDLSDLDRGYWQSREFLFYWKQGSQNIKNRIIYNFAKAEGIRAQDYLKKMTVKPIEEKFERIDVFRSFKTPQAMLTKDFVKKIVVFTDLFCSSCRDWIRALESMKVLSADLPFFFRPFFGVNDNYSVMAFEAAYCMEEIKPGSFWKFLFTFGKRVEKSKIEEHIFSKAKEYELFNKDFKACFFDRKFKANVQEQIEYGKSLGITSGPVAIAGGFVFKEYPGDKVLYQIEKFLANQEDFIPKVQKQQKAQSKDLPWYLKTWHYIKSFF